METTSQLSASSSRAIISSKSSRIDYVDVAKGLGLIIVVFGHLYTYGGGISRIIFSFHMPLFFILSGYCFSPERSTDFENYLIKKVKSLLLPYAIFCLIGFAFSFCISSWRSGLSNYTLVEVFFNTQPETLHVGQIWFLVCLFWVEILAYFVYKYILSKMHPVGIIIVLGLLVWIANAVPAVNIGLFIYGRWPFKMDSALMAMVFYFIGYYIKQLRLFEMLANRRFLLCLICAFCIALDSILAYRVLGLVNICNMMYNNVLLYIVCSLLGSVGIISFAILLRNCKILMTLGKNSLLLFASHSFFIFAYCAILSSRYGYAVYNGSNISRVDCIIGGVAICILLWVEQFIFTKVKDELMRCNISSY